MNRLEQQDGAVLRVVDLSVRYNNRHVLTGACLHLKPGEIVTLVGPNGCGKSTLLKSIAGIVPSQNGSIFLHSADVTGDSAHVRIARGLGLLMQGGAVFPSLTVLENLAVAARTPAQRSLRKSIAWETFPHLEGLAHRRAGLLSGGERQMLALAMLLVQGGSVWLLDEPSGGLAPEGVTKLMDLIRHVNELHHIAVLMAEQNIHEGLRVAHRACFVKNGSIFEVSDPQGIVEPNLFSHIYSEGR
jgi:ABC-type branched-subunit amino acid transport system ATPase component